MVGVIIPVVVFLGCSEAGVCGVIIPLVVFLGCSEAAVGCWQMVMAGGKGIMRVYCWCNHLCGRIPVEGE